MGVNGISADVVNTIPGQIEVVEPELQMLFEQTDRIAKRVKASGKVQQVSRYLWRLPLKLYNGMHYTKFSGNGGSYYHGTSLVLSNLEAGYYYTNLGVQLTQEQLDTSQNTNQSVVNVFNDALANAMVEAGVYDDISFHQTGTGILTNSSSAVTNSTNATMTFNAAGDYLHTSMLREGMCVDVWDTTGATLRVAGTGAPIIITAIDYDNFIVTLNQTVTSLTTGDILAIRNLTAYGPSTLTSFSSGYPGGPPANVSGGIGGDSFRHGYRYMTDTTTSNYFYGKQKSTFGTQLNPVYVNAQSQPIEWDHFNRVVAKIIQKRDPDVWKKLEGITSTAQRAAIWNLGTTIVTNMRTGTQFGNSYDGIPSDNGYEDTLTVSGLPILISKRADRSRIDFVNFDKVWRAQLHDTKFADVGKQGTIFEGRDSTGAVQAFIEFFVVQAYDFVCPDNGGFGVISSLALPPNWDA
jgi:hypothetical protein